MFAVAKKAPEPDVVLPVTAEWRQRVRDELAARPRGAQAELARAIDCPTGHLTELLADDDAPKTARYSRYVEPINRYFKWPSMMPLSQDTAELQHLIDGLDVEAKDLLRALREMSGDERKAMIALIMARKSNPDS